VLGECKGEKKAPKKEKEQSKPPSQKAVVTSVLVK